jgi:NAD kinase
MGVAVTCHKAICKLFENQSLSSFSAYTDLGKDTDVFFSVGGDGTLLRSLELIRDTEIPVIGVNTGRLGFLATLQADDIQVALQAFVDRQYRVEKRTLLEVEIEGASARIYPMIVFPIENKNACGYDDMFEPSRQICFDLAPLVENIQWSPRTNQPFETTLLSD